MVLINGIELNPSIAWSERYDSHGVMQTKKTTLGGRALISTAPLHGGRAITLVASEDSGWLRKSVVDALMALASTPGQVVTLTYHGDLVGVPVVFSHHEAPAVSMQPLLPKSSPDADDYFIGTIKLMTV